MLTLTVTVPDVLGHEDDERDTVWLGLIVPDTVEHIVGDTEEEGDDVTEIDPVPVIVPEADEEEETLAEPLGLFETLVVKVPETETDPEEDTVKDPLELGEIVPDMVEHVVGDPEGEEEEDSDSDVVPVMDSDTEDDKDTLNDPLGLVVNV